MGELLFAYPIKSAHTGCMDLNSIGTSNKVGLAVDHGNVILSGQHWGDSGGVVRPESEEDNPCLYMEKNICFTDYCGVKSLVAYIT